MMVILLINRRLVKNKKMIEGVYRSFYGCVQLGMYIRTSKSR